MSFLTWWYWPKYSNSFLTEPAHATIFQPHWNSQVAWPLASVLWFPGSPSIKLHLGFFIKFDIPKVATGGIKEFMHHLNFFFHSTLFLSYCLAKLHLPGLSWSCWLSLPWDMKHLLWKKKKKEYAQSPGFRTDVWCTSDISNLEILLCPQTSSSHSLLCLAQLMASPSFLLPRSKT